MATLKNVISYGGGPKPGQLIVANEVGTKTILFDAATAINASRAFFYQPIRSWAIDLPVLENASYMFQGCTMLATWSAATPCLKNGSNMFNSCSFTEWHGTLDNLEDGTSMFYGCRKIAVWDTPLPKLRKADFMFQLSQALVSFRVGMPSLSDAPSMFTLCRLDADSVELILTSIPEYESGTHRLDLGYRSEYKDSASVAALLGTTPPIAAGTYTAKGWTITVPN